MANDFQLSQVLNFLRGKHIKISAHNEWLRGCYDYYLSENQSSDNSLQVLKNFVYEQWLLADLRDVSEACLPQNISVADKMILSDTYALQVDVMVNIAESFYSQLQKLKKLALENLEVTDVEKQSWEPKAKRMLKLSCTDGVHQVYGMEYEPIPALREPFVPGCKIVVNGPVECRKGVILLTSRNFSMLGGEVDSLITENSQLNVIARKLNEVGGDEEIRDTIPTVTDYIGTYTNNAQTTDATNSIPTSESRPSTQETIAFTQFNDENMNDDDDALFLNDHLMEVESLLNVGEKNYLSDTHEENKSSTSTINPRGNNLSVLIERLPVTTSSISSSISLATISSSSHMEEQIVRTTRPSIIDRFIQSENVNNNSDSSSTGNTFSPLCSETTIQALLRLHECSAMRLDTTYKCKARVTKLRSKPRIKGEKWLMSVDIADEEASLEVTFHSSFLDGIFGYTALEVLSQRDRIKFNDSIKEKIDQIIKKGALKILSLQGEFFVKHVSINDLPTVMRVHENTVQI